MRMSVMWKWSVYLVKAVPLGILVKSHAKSATIMPKVIQSARHIRGGRAETPP